MLSTLFQALSYGQGCNLFSQQPSTGFQGLHVCSSSALLSCSRLVVLGQLALPMRSIILPASRVSKFFRSIVILSKSVAADIAWCASCAHLSVACRVLGLVQCA